MLSCTENRERTTMAAALDGVWISCAADVWMRTWKHMVSAGSANQV